MRYLLLIFISIITIIIVWININLCSENYAINESKADILLQLNFLESEIKNKNLGDRMQLIFPEGFVFVHSLYGLSWCELALSDKTDLKLKEKAIAEALFAFNEINSDKAKWTFDKQLRPENGIFYCGWKNYLLSKILLIDTNFLKNQFHVEMFHAQSDSIKNVLENSYNPYLESYHLQAWPADMFVAVASLSNHDKIFKPEYQGDIQTWLKKVKNRLDLKTLMVPHQVDSETGKPIEGARGSSISLILRILAEIDPEFANEQYKLFNKYFVSTTFGLPSIREYPNGQFGTGDIDSGPVIFGVGFAATINSIGTMSYFDTTNLKDNLYKTINAFGFATKNSNQKKYLFGKLPIADAFIAWGRATKSNEIKKTITNSKNWRIKFHLISLVIIFIIWLTAFFNKISNEIKTILKKQ